MPPLILKPFLRTAENPASVLRVDGLFDRDPVAAFSPSGFEDPFPEVARVPFSEAVNILSVPFARLICSLGHDQIIPFLVLPVN